MGGPGVCGVSSMMAARGLSGLPMSVISMNAQHINYFHLRRSICMYRELSSGQRSVEIDKLVS
jgi:hypothetical protein